MLMASSAYAGGVLTGKSMFYGHQECAQAYVYNIEEGLVGMLQVNLHNK